MYELKLAIYASLILFSIVTFLNFKNIKNIIMPAKTYYESNKRHHKKVSCDYYHNNKDHVLNYMKNKYDDLSKEEKDVRALYAKNLI